MKILFCSPCPNDVNSFYRGIGPLSCLPYLDPSIQINHLTDLSWSALALCDVVFLQRPFSPEHMEIARIAKQMDKRLWLDYDDDLLNVPPSHGDVYQLYRQGSIQQAISAILSWADVVTVTNEYLADLYSEWTSRCTIVPNAYHDYWLPLEPPTTPRERTIFWRGSAGHIADLAAFANDLAAVAAANPEWKWSFMGAVPWCLEGRIPGLEYRSPVDIFTYHHVVRDVIRPAIMIAPLRDIPFNRGRSNSAAIEALSFGAQFAATIEELSNYLNGAQSPAWLDWGVVKNELFLSHINYRRLDILRSLA